jgi:isopenicillin N synthase-like dioxygenase
LGFVRLTGHNVDKMVTEPAYKHIREFFALSVEEKRKYIVKGGAGQRGYTPYLSESAKDSNVPDLKEFWHVGRELLEEDDLYEMYPPNVWPAELPAFKKSLLDLYDSLEDCSEVLLQALAIYLGEDKDIFTMMTDKGNTILRALFYPAMADQKPIPGAIRAAAHEDINFITLLIGSTSAGLQILTREGKWLDVEVNEGEIIADAGDMLSRVTNSYIPATTHRVINPDDTNTDRYSIPFFVHPRPDSLLKVLDSCKGDGFPEPPRDILGIDFLNERLAELGLLKI